MVEYNELYKKNQILDNKFEENYSNNNEIIEKNIVELLVELGELANETRCFKYWSKKPASSKEIILEEFADCLIMALYFCNKVNLSLNEKFDTINEKDIIQQFKKLYSLVSNLNSNLDKIIVKQILINIDHLGKLLKFTREEIIAASLKKIKINFERFEIEY